MKRNILYSKLIFIVLINTIAGSLYADNVSNNSVNLSLSWSKDDPVPTEIMNVSRMLREKFLADPYRPGYHFVIAEGMAIPGDGNGAFYANGRYHLMYLYLESTGTAWGHISSKDMIHWRHHQDAIVPDPVSGEECSFSGGAFLDDDGTAYISYWALGYPKLNDTDGVAFAKSNDYFYEKWEKFQQNPLIKSFKRGIAEVKDENGQKAIVGCADPSNIWKRDGKYYMLTGNLLVLREYGKDEDSPEIYKGDRLYLFESEDLLNWNYKGIFYDRRTDKSWTKDSEDNMCPSFLPLPDENGNKTGKHLLLFISHNMGCQYYIGTYDIKNNKFLPEKHGRMSWVDNSYFAPEALMAPDGRQIMWAWFNDRPKDHRKRGWCGVYGLPRSMWLGKDQTLHFEPIDELKSLRFNQKKWNNIIVNGESSKKLDVVPGDSCELELVIDLKKTTAKQFGIRVRTSPGKEEATPMYVDMDAGKLCVDTRNSGASGHRDHNVLEQAPFVPTEEQRKLTLRVFVDKSVVEIYADTKQGIARRIYPLRDDSLGIELFAEGGKAFFSEAKAWEMMPSNPY